MTRAQRRSHLIAWLVLAPAIVAVLISALVVRSQVNSRLSLPTPIPPETRP